MHFFCFLLIWATIFCIIRLSTTTFDGDNKESAELKLKGHSKESLLVNLNVRRTILGDLSFNVVEDERMIISISAITMDP